ncbi:MAG TPA: CBS and ACT domain-containing protein [Dehalococcoidia bacterium]|nr:CBS and ACT domain-containing protein [Dehalococcoidia bacterium]
MLVQEFMTANPTTVTPDDTALVAFRRMRAGRFRHLPVVRDGRRLVGILTDRDLRQLQPMTVDEETSENWLHRLDLVGVDDIMTPDPVTGWPEMPLEEAARILYQGRFGSLPIVAGDQLVGIITDTDIFRAFVDLTGVLEASSRLTIALGEAGDPIAEAIRLIHEAGVSIVSVLTEAGGAPGSRRLVARVATVDPRPVIARLRNAGLTVHWDGEAAANADVAYRRADPPDRT